MERRGDDVYAIDLKSTNGSFVNGEPIEEHQLQSGEVVLVGGTEIELVQESADGEQASHNKDESNPSTTVSLRYEVDTEGLLESIHEEERKSNYEKLYTHLRTLISISALINEADQTPQLLQNIVNTTAQIFNAERGCLMIRERGGTYRKYFSNHQSDMPASEWTLSKTILREALRHGMSVMSSDAGADDRFRAGESIQVQDIKSVLCVPVESKDEILGAIYLDTVIGLRTYTRDDLELLTAVGRQAGTAIKRELLREEKELMLLDAIRVVIAAVEAKDQYTAGHSARVAAYTQTLAGALGYNEFFIERLRHSAHLHDVGKIGIPEGILNKPSGLSDSEFKLIQAHPVIGANILSKLRGIEDVVRAVKHHHERIDGKGYPDGLEGEAIPLMSRLIALPDAFDAMTSDRAYRKGMSVDVAIAEFQRGSGSQFDTVISTKMVELLQSGIIVPIKDAPDTF